MFLRNNTIKIHGTKYNKDTTKLTVINDKSINNKSIKLPKNLHKKFDKLHILDLHGNNLNTIPDSIKNIATLTTLDLHNNCLTNIPDCFQMLYNFDSLQILYLDNNRLTSLPESIGLLYNLQSLYLNDNRLFNLPTSIRQLIKLSTLKLNNNPIGWENIFILTIKYLKDIQNKDYVVPDNIVTSITNCNICMDNPINSVFVHGKTGHSISCHDCGITIMELDYSPSCPKCRQPVDKLIQIFM
jgi:hypothetical protein